MKLFFALFLLVSMVASQATLESTVVYTVDGCESEFEHDCKAYFCIDSEEHAQILISATTLVMGSPANGTGFAGIAVWGYTTPELSGEADNAVVVWFDTSNSSDWSTVTVNITFQIGSAFSHTEVYNLILEDERAFTGSETCLWFPESNGYYDGKFSIELGTGEAFSFYVCGNFEGKTFSEFHGQAYGGLEIPFGNIQMQYFINISGYFVEYNGRRFYHGFTYMVTASQNEGDCDPDNGLIFSPRTNPLLVVVTDNEVAGTIEGWTTTAELPESGFPDGKSVVSITITGSPDEIIAQPRFCITSPQYLEVCEGVDPYYTEPEVVTTTTYEIVVETTFEETQESILVESEMMSGDDDDENSAALLFPALFILSMLF